jgi:hypothetical protein
LKIDMLRLFCDCIDLSDADSDGWVVHEWLKKAYAAERKPISQNSITWLLHLTANEEYVEFGTRNVWSALQHAVRSILNHGRFGKVLERILNLSTEEFGNISQRRVDALGAWLALRVNGLVILPMVVSAGSFLQMRGFDWVDDVMPHDQFVQALPNIYAAWCYAILDAVERLEAYMREELEQCLMQLSLTREAFLDAMSHSVTASSRSKHGHAQRIVCTDCGEDYTALGDGLVEPTRIAITECVLTGHDFTCNCHTMDNFNIHRIQAEPLVYTGAYHEGEAADIDIDEDFFDAEPYLFDTKSSTNLNVFSNTATLLYRAHGRVWIGNYTLGEQLCADCFLARELYIGEDGLAADFPPMPKNFEGLRVKWLVHKS